MTSSADRTMLNKVPLVTLAFWVIKIMATTIGETGADFLNVNLGLGLTATSLIMAAALVVFLVVQLRQSRYVGTLITDNLSDNFGVSLFASTALFATSLIVTFFLWYRREHTLSIHEITTRRRETYYWAAILFTFALGTAAGDLVAEQLGLGYLAAGAIFGGLIALITLGYYAFRLNAVLAFWLAYILTRPLGASIGDGLTQPRSGGGLGLSTMVVSGAFLVIIVALVIHLTRKPGQSGEPPS
jgi:uncharacterized membrane-anchored protein